MREPLGRVTSRGGRPVWVARRVRISIPGRSSQCVSAFPSFLPPAVPISEGERVPVLPCQDRVVRGVRAPQMDAPVAGVTLDE